MRPYFHRHYRPPLHKTHPTSSSFIPNAFHISSSNAHQSHSLKTNISGRRRMAQRTEKEETIASCVNNCGPSTSSAGVKFGEKSPRSSSGKRPQLERTADRAETSRDLNDEAKSQLDRVPVIRREVNRCSGCRRKVGLTGFRCRCGDLFCSDHRYSDRHECSYDYKAAGREAIARENPVVKAAKLIKL